MRLKKILSLLVAMAMLLSCVGITAMAEETGVAKIGDTPYTTFDEALTAAKAMTGDVTVEIYDKVILNQSLSGSYSSIKFVGKADDAEIYLDVQGYIEAIGKDVAFEDLKLSKSEGGFIDNAGFMNVAFGVYQANSVSYTDCTFTNGAYASSGENTFYKCTFYRSHDKYGLWAYGDVEVVVDDCTFADYRGIKMYAEGAAKTVNLTVKNTDFSAVTDKPAIVLTYGESVALENNTYSSTGVFELDLDGAPNGTLVASDVAPTCKNDNGACGVLVDGKIYTTVAQAAAVATEDSTVTLLHDSTETVEFAEGVTLDKNGHTADGVIVEGNTSVTEPEGSINGGLVNLQDANRTFLTIESYITYANESIVVKVYDANDTLLTTSALIDTDRVILGKENWGGLSTMVGINCTDEWWNTVWEDGKLSADYVPAKATLFVDGVEMNTATIQMRAAGTETEVVWADVPGVNPDPVTYPVYIGEQGYETLQKAIDAAQDGDVITVLADINLANTELQLLDGSYDTYFLVEGKSVTINLNGKTISGEYTGTNTMLVGVFSTDNNGHLTIAGNGTVDVTATNKVYSLIANYEDGCTITIENGTYNLDKAADNLIYSGGTTDGAVTVNGGTFTLGNVGTGENGKPWIFNVLGAGDHYVLVNGGTFNADINRQHWSNEVFVSETHYTVKNADGTYTVKEGAVAYVNEGMLTGPYFVRKNIGYATIDEALAAADQGDTVTIFAGDYTGDLSVEKDITVVGETDAEGNNLVNISGKLSITADGATVKNININNGSSNAGYISAKDVTVEGCSVVGGNGFRYCYTSGTVTFKDSVITGNTYGIHFDGSAGGNIVIDNCTITGWTSFASKIEKVTISKTEFAKGNYNQLRFYQDVEITNSKFNPDMTVDFGKENVKLDVTNCSVTDGSPITDVIYLADIAIMGVVVTVDGKAIVVEASVLAAGETEAKYYLTLADAVAAAESGEIITILKDGEYELPHFTNKELTFKGTSKDNVIINDAPDARTQGWSGSTFHFENLTAKGATANYHGLANGVVTVTYKDCNVNNLRFLYATDMVSFEDCVFNASGVEHSFWTYGASKVTVTNCTFEYTDRAVNCYSENGAVHETDISFFGCTFTYTGTAEAPEGAVEINSGSVKSIDVSFENCNAPEKGEMWFNSQWDGKKGANTVVKVDDTQVWPAPVYVAQIGEQGYETLQKAIDAAEAGDTVTLISDVEMTDSVVISSKALTLDLGGYTIYDKNTDVLTSEDDIWGLIALENGAKLTICGNGTIECNYTVTENGWIGMAFAIDVDATSELIVDSGCITNGNGGIQTSGKVTVNNGTFVSHNGGTCIMAVGPSANVTVNDGIFKDSVGEDDVYTGSGAIWAGFGATININGGTYDFAADPEHEDIVWTLFPAQNAISGYGSNANMTVSGGTFVNFNPATDVVVNYSPSTGFTFGSVVAEDYAAIPNLDGNYVVGAAPTATVNNLGMQTVPAGEYGVWDGSFTEGTTDMPLSFVMQFLADQTEADMETSPYADWYGDFVITFEGLENGSFVADGCYLAGFYGDFGWVKVPVDGMTIEDGARYPVMLGVGLGQKYDYICSGVQDFKCALYLTPEILAANPNLTVNLELAVVDNSKGEDAAAEALVKNENIYEVVDYDYEADDFVVKYVAEVNGVGYATLQAALDAAAAGTGNVTVEILEDIDLTNVEWNPVTVSAPGYPVVTVNGNNKTITGLSDMLFAGTWAGGSGLIINDLTIADSNIVNDENDTKGTVGVGAFIGFPQASATITLNNCHLVNSTVSGGHWTGGLIGYAAGYAGNDGPVFMNLIITNCSVTDSTITGKGSVGGVIGHGSGNGWTNVVIENTDVSGNTITSTGSSVNKAGAVMGTIGAAGQPTTANGETKTGGASISATVSGNTVKSNDTTITTVYGRQGTPTGMLYVTGGNYDNYPIEENVSYAAPKDGYEIVQNGDGTWGVTEKEEVELFEFYQMNLDLESSIKVNFYIRADYFKGTNYYAEIVHSSANGDITRKVDFADWEDNNSYKQISYTDLVAKNMADTITITIYDGNGNQVSVAQPTSIKRYAENYLRDNAGKNNKWVTSFVDMLNYGAEAQKYFDYNEENLANAGIDKYQIYATENDVELKNIAEVFGPVYQANLDLENRIVYNGYFKNVTSDMTAEISYTNHSGKQITHSASIVKSGSYYKVAVDTLVIADANQLITITVYDGDGNVYAYIKDTVNSYLCRVIPNDDTGFEPLARAMAKFTASAHTALHTK